MTMTRRQALRLLGAGVALSVSGCSLLRRTSLSRLLTSSAPLPKPYMVPLPIPTVAKPYGYPTDIVQPGTHRDYVFPLEQRAATLAAQCRGMMFSIVLPWIIPIIVPGSGDGCRAVSVHASNDRATMCS